MFAIILFSFVLFHVVPSDPARLILGPNADEGRVSSLQNELGLDRPLQTQFLRYLRQLASLDFGKSYTDKRPVLTEIGSRFKITLVLISVCMILTLIYSFLTVFLLYKNISTATLNFLCMSIPTFLSGILVALFSFKYFPFTSFNGAFYSYQDFLFFIPPAFALAIYPMGILSNILSEEFNSILTSNYIRTSRAYAVPPIIIFFKYSLRNAILPYLAALSNQLPALFTGAFILEIIFSIPGIGSLLVTSIFSRDFPMIEGIIILNGLVFILINFIFESAYPIVDPRIKTK